MSGSNEELKKTALADCVHQKSVMASEISNLQVDLALAKAEVGRQDSMIAQLVQQRNDDVQAFRKSTLMEHLRTWWNR